MRMLSAMGFRILSSMSKAQPSFEEGSLFPSKSVIDDCSVSGFIPLSFDEILFISSSHSLAVLACHRVCEDGSGSFSILVESVGRCMKFMEYPISPTKM